MSDHPSPRHSPDLIIPLLLHLGRSATQQLGGRQLIPDSCSVRRSRRRQRWARNGLQRLGLAPVYPIADEGHRETGASLSAAEPIIELVPAIHLAPAFQATSMPSPSFSSFP